MSDNGIDWDYHAEKQAIHFPPPEARERVDPLFKIKHPGGLALDAGCSIARWKNVIERLGYTYVGVDQSLVALKIAKRLHPDAMLVRCYIQWLPFKSEVFSAVFSVAMLQHQSHETKRVMLKEFKRVLKNDGLFIMNEATYDDKPDDWTDGRAFNHKTWMAFVSQNGFTPISYENPYYFFKASNNWEVERFPENYDEFYFLMFMLPLILKAKTVVETGLDRGNSTRIFLEASKISGLKLYTIDVKDYPDTRKRLEDLGLTKNWVFIQNDSVKAGSEWKGEKIDLLYLDSHHSYEHVKAELEAWLPHLSEKAVILCHETTPQEKHQMYETGGPKRALTEFAEKHKEWTFLNLKYGNGLGVLIKL